MSSQAKQASGAAPVEAQTDSRRKTEILISRLGALRDGLLLLAGVVYFLGYISWTIYALTTGIGMLPVLEAQYFAAGIVPAFIFLLFIWSVRALRAFQRWLKRPVSDKLKRLQKTLSYCAAGLLLIFPLLKLVFGKGSEGWFSWLPFVFLGFAILASFLSRAKGDRLTQMFGLFLLWSYTILGAFWLILGYNLEVFPRLPSELGGPKPRCTQLDIDRAHISPQTQLLLEGRLSAPGGQTVFRSLPIYLIFDGSDYVVIAQRAGPLSRTNPAYRVRKDAVKAVFACESERTTSNSY